MICIDVLKIKLCRYYKACLNYCMCHLLLFMLLFVVGAFLDMQES